MRGGATSLLVRAAIGGGVAAGALGLALPGIAGAAFPGAHGRIVFDSTRNGAQNLFSVDPDSISSVREVTSSGNTDSNPSGSPDGTKVVFRSDRDGYGQIYVVNALNDLDQVALPPDGASNLSNTAVADDKDASFFPDSLQVVFSRKQFDDGNYQLYTMPATGGPATLLLAAPPGCDDTLAQVNPTNPNQIAFNRTCTSSQNGPTSPHLMLLRLGVPNPVIDLTAVSPTYTPASGGGTTAYPIIADVAPDWAPDGSRIAVATRGPSGLFGGKYQIFSLKPDGTDRRQIWGFGNPSYTGSGLNDLNPAYSPAGDKLAFARQTGTVNGLDVFTTSVSNLSSPAVAGPANDVTPSRGPDNDPTWLPVPGSPPPVIPEVPLAVLLPLSGCALAGVAGWRRARRLRLA
jgi:TolB protein